MKASITSIQLRSPLAFFALSRQAMHIIKQLRSTSCQEFKKREFWKLHYTMTLWPREEDLKAFAASGAHREAMKKAAGIAAEIRTITIDAEELPDWKEAKRLLQKAKVITY